MDQYQRAEALKGLREYAAQPAIHPSFVLVVRVVEDMQRQLDQLRDELSGMVKAVSDLHAEVVR